MQNIRNLGLEIEKIDAIFNVSVYFLNDTFSTFPVPFGVSQCSHFRSLKLLIFSIMTLHMLSK